MSARLGAAVLAMVCLAGCAPGGGYSSGKSSGRASAPAPAGAESLVPYFGSYASAVGNGMVVIARTGWYFDLRSSDYRTIYKTASPNRFTIGPTFERAEPKVADLVFGPGTLSVVKTEGSRTLRRIDYRHSDVTIPARGADLASTITEPLGAGPHPGIVVVHGSEPGQRVFYDIWVGIYTSLGVTVLTYDKRGNGSSTGIYPGDTASEAALTTYADDAAAALDFLGHWPGVDPKQVGFHGGSQGGWTVPLAMKSHPGAAFAILVSAAATTVDQTDLWASFSDHGAQMPNESTEQMLAAVRADHSGYDPTPALQALNAPALWLLGTNDRTVPTAVCLEILESMHKPNFTIEQLPTGHGLLVNSTGLEADDERSPGLAPQLVPAIDAWIKQVTAR